MFTGIDHLVIAVPDPDAAAAELSAALGLTPGGGGRHDGLGTFNRLIWLGDTLPRADRRLRRGPRPGVVGRAADPRASSRPRPGRVSRPGRSPPTTSTPTSPGSARPDRASACPRRASDSDRMAASSRWRLAAAPTLEPDGPPFLIEHDPTSAEWTAAERAARATGPARLTALEIGVDDVAGTTFRFLRTVGLRFRPSLQGRGARDADVGRQIVRIRPRRPAVEPSTTIRLTIPDRRRAGGGPARLSLGRQPRSAARTMTR